MKRRRSCVTPISNSSPTEIGITGNENNTGACNDTDIGNDSDSGIGAVSGNDTKTGNGN